MKEKSFLLLLHMCVLHRKWFLFFLLSVFFRFLGVYAFARYNCIDVIYYVFSDPLICVAKSNHEILRIDCRFGNTCKCTHTNTSPSNQLEIPSMRLTRFAVLFLLFLMSNKRFRIDTQQCTKDNATRASTETTAQDAPISRNKTKQCDETHCLCIACR